MRFVFVFLPIGITSDTVEVSSRASALEAIVANDYIDLLNSLPIVKLLHAKWVRGARGHYFGQLALFCTCLVFHALLCQHRRQGLVDVFFNGARESALKEAIQSPAMCRSPYVGTSTAPNGSLITTTVGRRLPRPGYILILLYTLLDASNVNRRVGAMKPYAEN